VLALAAALAVVSCDREPLGEPSPRIREVLGEGGPAVVELPTGDTLHLSETVAAFYRDRGYRQAWTDYDEVLDRGLALIETMGRSTEDGFSPEAYRYALAARMVMEVEEDSLEEAEEPGQMAEVDLVLSEVFSRYASHLAGGALDPKSAGLDWQIKREEPDVRALLEALVADATSAALVDSLRPPAPEYRRMMAMLARYRNIEQAGGWAEIPEADPFEVGDTADAVAVLRNRLVAERDPVESALAARGSAAPRAFDESLREAVAHFQARHGLDPDGALGEHTLAELNTSVDRRIAEIELNMDRWRWLPRELGDLYVMVNVAGFELEVVERDSALLTMNVVVGKDAWRTPIFRDTMEYVVVNPYWNAPASIATDEIIPALRADPSYLERNRFEVLQGDRPVSVSEIDWTGDVAQRYRFRQRPGPGNALGDVKFLFPNPDDIYLHDTPAAHLFSQSSRAFSHGCIRVEKPVELARLIFAKATDRSPDSYDDLRARGGEQWVPLTKPVPVYILYFTAYAHRDGTVSFHPDIYERDRRLEEQAGTTSKKSAQ